MSKTPYQYINLVGKNLKTEINGLNSGLKEYKDDINVLLESDKIVPTNLYNPDELSVHKRVDENGNIVEDTNESTTGYIPCAYGDTIYTFRTYSGDVTLSPLTAVYVSEFDKNKQFILRSEQYKTNGTKGQYAVSNENTKYVRVEAPAGIFTDYRYSVIVNWDGTTNVYKSYFKPYYNSKVLNKFKKTKTKITVMSYNAGKFSYGVNNGYTDEATLQEKFLSTKRFFGKANADIIGFQEKKNGFDANNTINSNTEMLDYLYPYYATRDVSRLEWDVSEIRSKYEISNGGYSSLSTNRNYTYGVIDLGVEIYLLNVHLDPSSATVRETEISEILPLLADKEYFIMTGDFNNHNGVEELNAFKTAGYNIANGGLFGTYTTTTTDGQCIDNIITSGNIIIENVFVPDYAYAMCSSDHYPIIAELRIG